MSLLHANDRPGRYPESWYAATAAPPAPFPPLSGAARAGVAVVGGGYTGLSAALHLAGAGHDVALVEAHRVGFGASGRNGGQLGSGQRVSQAALARRMGAADARRLWALSEDAKALVKRLIAEHAIDCDWRPGLVEVARSEAGVAALHAEAEALSRDYGYAALDCLDAEGLRAHVDSPVYAGGIHDREAGHLHPLRFALGLARAARTAGVRIFERSEVTALTPGPPADLATAAGRLRADHVILAAGGYLDGLAPAVSARVMPLNNFMVATEPLAGREARLLPSDSAVVDERFVVDYFRRSADGRLLFGGGESYGDRFPHDIAARVRPRLEAVFPSLKGVAIDYAWGGTLAVTRSRLPAFLAPAPGVFSASGYSGHGVGLACLAGRILAEAVAGRRQDFDLMARLPVARFPGGAWGGRALMTLAMAWLALRDRLAG